MSYYNVFKKRRKLEKKKRSKIKSVIKLVPAGITFKKKKQMKWPGYRKKVPRTPIYISLDENELDKKGKPKKAFRESRKLLKERMIKEMLDLAVTYKWIGPNIKLYNKQKKYPYHTFISTANMNALPKLIDRTNHKWSYPMPKAEMPDLKYIYVPDIINPDGTY